METGPSLVWACASWFSRPQRAQVCRRRGPQFGHHGRPSTPGDETVVIAGGCGQVHLPTGRSCVREAGHRGGCEFVPPDHQPELVAATRRLIGARSPADVVAASVDLVLALGGSVEAAASAGRNALPFDLGCGEADSLLPVTEPASALRRRLEALLPSFLEDARRTIMSLRRSGESGTAADQ